MKLVANLIPLTSGGGQRVGLNFILSMIENDFFGHDVHFLVTKGSGLEKELLHLKVSQFTSVSANWRKRIGFELFSGRQLLQKINPDVVYTLFGYSFFGKRFKQVSGVAYSNLFFPEIDFWVEYKGLAKLKRKLVDYYRSFGLKKATALIFENPAMERRAHSLWSFSPKKTTYIPPSIHQTKLTDTFLDEPSLGVLNILMLCGWQRNKNIHLVPQIAANARARQLKIHFTITVALDGSEDSQLFEKEMRTLGVEDMVSLIGQVPPEKVSELYSNANVLMLLSKLESFSNNIIEAWTYKVPLFITNHAWAKNICGEAAFYVERDDPRNIVDRLQEVMNSQEMLTAYRVKARKTLLSYPSIDEKTMRELKFVNQAISDI